MKRNLTIAVAAVAAMAFGAPAAHAGAAHLMGYYKVEKHIDMEGELGDYTISCPNSDIAVDGMWRIDNVDQDDDYIYGTAPSTPHFGKLDVLNSVEPVAAYADFSDVSQWHFKFVPLSGGDVQGKLFLFCMPHRPNPNQSHSVSWLPDTNTSSRTDSVLAPGNGGASGPLGATYSNLYSPDANQTECGTGKIAIQPGFEWTTPDAYGKPYLRAPSTFSATSGWRSWDWGFFTPTGGTVKLTWRCLAKLSDWSNKPASATGHRHKFVVLSKRGTTPNPDSLKPTDDTTVQVICGEHYKLGLAYWHFGPASKYDTYVWDDTTAGNYWWQKYWYLGMDPRPKARAFRILNVDTVAHSTGFNTGPPPPYDADFGGLCFKDKTT